MKAGRKVDDVGIDSTFLTPNWMVWNLELNKEHCNSQSLRILAIFESFNRPSSGQHLGPTEVLSWVWCPET
jgi:hypothetical protein